MDDLLDIQNDMEKDEVTSLVNRVFSWSIKDILNRNKINKIPDRFGSVDEYLECFVPHLLEETRTELSSSLKSLSEAPVFEVDLEVSSEGTSYNLLLEERMIISTKYKPKRGDLIALTKERPRRIDDLNPLLLCYVCSYESDDLKIYVQTFGSIPYLEEKSVSLKIQTSRSIPYHEEKSVSFGVYLMNLKTNTRIWNALHNKTADSSLIQTVLQENTLAKEQCFSCTNDVESSDQDMDLIRSLKLNSSQKAAILSCLKTRNCFHRQSVKLIRGPPGTGKTNTVASLLFSLLNLKCKTVVCAPTNTALVKVASRLLFLFKEASSPEHATYGLGNIVLSGNRDKMGIEKDDLLLDVFLEDRIRKLFAPVTGWEHRLKSFINFLEEPEANYEQHLKDMEKAEKKNQEETEWKKKRKVIIPTLGEFVETKFNKSSEDLERDMFDLYTHLPKSFISSEQVKNMVAAQQAIQPVRTFLRDSSSRRNIKKGSLKLRCFQRLICQDFLLSLRSLPTHFEVSDMLEIMDIGTFCLQNADIILCTASGAADMTPIRTGTVDLLMVDEAAQLKECESVALLQLFGLRHAVLIGDEFQLPAMVHNNECEREKFGRSLFERLALHDLNNNFYILFYQF